MAEQDDPHRSPSPSPPHFRRRPMTIRRPITRPVTLHSAPHITLSSLSSVPSTLEVRRYDTYFTLPKAQLNLRPSYHARIPCFIPSHLARIRRDLLTHGPASG